MFFEVAPYEYDISDPKPPHPLLGLTVLLPFSYLAMSVPDVNMKAPTMRERSLFAGLHRCRQQSMYMDFANKSGPPVQSLSGLMAENPPGHVRNCSTMSADETEAANWHLRDAIGTRQSI